MVHSEILVRPLISEKSSALGSKLNKFGFVVSPDANKIQIRQAVEKMYGVTVKSVDTLIMPGKFKQRYTKTGIAKGQKGYMKKAIVTLKAGDTIDFYANV